MGNTSSSNSNNSRRPARATPIPEVHAVPLTRLTTERPIIMESKIAEQAEVILNQEGELRRLRHENAELQASNDRLVLEMNRFCKCVEFVNDRSGARPEHARSYFFNHKINRISHPFWHIIHSKQITWP